MQVKRTGMNIELDPKRVLLKSFEISNKEKSKRIISQILAMTEKEVHKKLEEVNSEFGKRHENLLDFFRNRFAQIKIYLPVGVTLSEEQILLTGAYFSHEFSIEAAALFNPSIVWHPDQSGLENDSRRFILSLRATGEGHISSVTFRSGIIDSTNKIILDSNEKYISSGDIITRYLDNKNSFKEKIKSLGLLNNFSNRVLAHLEDSYTVERFENCIHEQLNQNSQNNEEDVRVGRELLALARGNYERVFSEKTGISSRVIFPASPSEINGIEDARFVQFYDENGEATYYATYTAYDGYSIQPQLLETKDFLHFKISTLHGTEVDNKGMALFPRKINNQFVMLSRQGGEKNYVMFSDNIYTWNNKILIQEPEFPWEFIQIGNCGSPIETDYGWLVLSHGVGPMRKYSISAFLLDLNNPAKMAGKLKKPLLSPEGNEREGYVPNVVYSCGALVHNGELILPYAMSDYACTFATINLETLLKELTS